MAIAHIHSDYTGWHAGNFLIGHLLGEIVNFIIVALVVAAALFTRALGGQISLKG